METGDLRARKFVPTILGDVLYGYDLAIYHVLHSAAPWLTSTKNRSAHQFHHWLQAFDE
jgi:hypothetical protein